jgi:hypothetical protein
MNTKSQNQNSLLFPQSRRHVFFMILGLCLGSFHAISSASVEEPFDLGAEVTRYKERYRLTDTSSKLIDNAGNGFEYLYGLRNTRVVLHGVYYRGGGNNSNNKYGKKDNMNPLPAVGLDNLCREGFAKSFYFYPDRYDEAEPRHTCEERLTGSRHVMTYHQATAMKAENHPRLLEQIFRRIRGEIAGPIYGHCWNGWHASGLIAALTLRQFCDYTAAQALTYWEKNTDGNHQGFKTVRRMISEFKPYPQWAISNAEKRLICPDFSQGSDTD